MEASSALKGGAILAALCLLLLVFGPTVREQRSRPTCLQNMRRLGQALALYVADNDGVWPDENAWRLHKIGSQPLSGCPLVPAGGREGIPGYAYNSALRYGASVRQIAYPERTIAACEEPADVMFTYTVNPYIDFPEEAIQTERGWERHAGGGHYLFCDGHVEWLRLEQVMGVHDTEMGNAGVMASFALSSKEQIREQWIKEFGTRP